MRSIAAVCVGLYFWINEGNDVVEELKTPPMMIMQ